MKIIYIKTYVNRKVAKYLYSWLNTKKESREDLHVNKVMSYLKNIFKDLNRRLKAC